MQTYELESTANVYKTNVKPLLLVDVRGPLERSTGQSSRPIGSNLELSWAMMGLSWGILGNIGAILRLSLQVLGAITKHLGAPSSEVELH